VSAFLGAVFHVMQHCNQVRILYLVAKLVLAPRKERRLRVFENTLLKRMF
jgi:hypothetical protein